MIKIKHVAAVMGCVAGIAAWAAPAAPLARLANGEVVSEQDLLDYLERRVDLRQTARNVWGVEGVVREMATARALALEGERVGIPRSVQEGVAPRRFDDVYALAVYRTQAPACDAPANEQEARQYYDAHPQAFVLPAQARVERIILPTDTKIGEGSAMAWLQDQARAVAQGKRQFGLIALRAKGEYSTDVQGDLGWINLDGDHTIMRALKTTNAGELLGPVQDGDFVYLFSVLQKREPRQLSWDDSKSFAVTRAVSYCREEAQTKIRSDLFQRYGVELDRAAIRELWSKNTQKPSEEAGTTPQEKVDDKADAKPQQ